MGLIHVVNRLIPVTRAVTPLTMQYKSGGEQAIGRFLAEQGIPFWYEQELLLNNGRYEERFLPDFSLRKKPKHIEYWGMVDHDKGYVKRMKYKMAIYHRNGVDFLSVYPSQLRGDKYKGMIEEFVKQRHKPRKRRRKPQRGQAKRRRR